MMSRSTGNNRVSALKRLGQSSPSSHSNPRLTNVSKTSSVTDARELLANRKKTTTTAFDARQLLNRQSSDTNPSNTIVRKNLLQNRDEANGKMVVVTGIKDMKIKDGRFISSATAGTNALEKKKNVFTVGSSTLITFRNNNNTTPVAAAATNSNQFTQKISFTKTITNPSVRREEDDHNSLADKKVVIRFTNDQYEKNLKLPQPATTTISSSPILQHHHNPPPVVKRLHDASIQTTPSSSTSRSPIRTSSHRQHTSSTTYEQDYSTDRTMNDDLYEPPIKRSSAASTRKPTEREQPVLSTGSVKRTSTGAPVSSKVSSNVSTASKQVSTASSTSTPGTILVTNLQPSVTEDDVIQLFSEIGRINEITTLSQGCVQIVYAKREHSEQAVARYHNRLLDGQFMYVSLQQPASYPTTQNPKATSSAQPTTKENGSSASSSSTTNQPLKFNAANASSNKIVIDPVFFRQALFQPSNNTANPVQFQVKL